MNVMLRKEAEYLWTDDHIRMLLVLGKDGRKIKAENGGRLSQVANISTAMVCNGTLLVDSMMALVSYASDL